MIGARHASVGRTIIIAALSVLAFHGRSSARNAKDPEDTDLDCEDFHGAARAGCERYAQGDLEGAQKKVDECFRKGDRVAECRALQRELRTKSVEIALAFDKRILNGRRPYHLRLSRDKTEVADVPVTLDHSGTDVHQGVYDLQLLVGNDVKYTLTLGVFQPMNSSTKVKLTFPPLGRLLYRLANGTPAGLLRLRRVQSDPAQAADCEASGSPTEMVLCAGVYEAESDLAGMPALKLTVAEKPNSPDTEVAMFVEQRGPSPGDVQYAIQGAAPQGFQALGAPQALPAGADYELKKDAGGPAPVIVRMNKPASDSPRSFAVFIRSVEGQSNPPPPPRSFLRRWGPTLAIAALFAATLTYALAEDHHATTLDGNATNSTACQQAASADDGSAQKCADDAEAAGRAHGRADAFGWMAGALGVATAGAAAVALVF